MVLQIPKNELCEAYVLIVTNVTSYISPLLTSPKGWHHVRHAGHLRYADDRLPHRP